MQVDTRTFGWSYCIYPTLFTRTIVHPDTVHMKHYSSCYYSLNMLFIATLSLKIPTLFTYSYYSYRHKVSSHEGSGSLCQMLNLEWTSTMQLNNIMNHMHDFEFANHFELIACLISYKEWIQRGKSIHLIRHFVLITNAKFQ